MRVLSRCQGLIMGEKNKKNKNTTVSPWRMKPTMYTLLQVGSASVGTEEAFSCCALCEAPIRLCHFYYIKQLLVNSLLLTLLFYFFPLFVFWFLINHFSTTVALASETDWGRMKDV